MFQDFQRFSKCSENRQNLFEWISFVEICGISQILKDLGFSLGFLRFSLINLRFSVLSKSLGFLKIFRIHYENVRYFYNDLPLNIF